MQYDEYVLGTMRKYIKVRVRESKKRKRRKILEGFINFPEIWGKAECIIGLGLGGRLQTLLGGR